MAAWHSGSDSGNLAVGRKRAEKRGVDTILFFIVLTTSLFALDAVADNPSYSTSTLNPPGYSDIYATAMTVGPDAYTWIAEGFRNRIGRLTVSINPTTKVASSTYTPFPAKPVFGPNSITTGADGNLWFTEQGGKIARMTTLGVITEFPAPSNAGAITSGPDGVPTSAIN